MDKGRRLRIPTNLCAGILFILAALTIRLLIPGQINLEKATPQLIDSQFLPKLLVYIMGAAGMILIFRSLILKNEEYKELSAATELRRAGFIVMLLCYVAAIDLIGFLFSSLLFAATFLFVLGIRKWSWYVIVMTGAVVIYIMFRFLLNVRFTSMWGV